tara:strand:- start:4009 stop:5493 length:1485 start_codon:yes stop_codon:yes gene_type:complete
MIHRRTRLRHAIQPIYSGALLCALWMAPAAAAVASSDAALSRFKLENDLRISESTAKPTEASQSDLQGEGEVPSLMTLVKMAEANDPSYHAAQAGLAAAREFKTIGRASMLPVMQASGSSSRNRQDREIQQGSQRLSDRRFYNAFSANLQLRQPIYAPEARARFDEAVALSNEAEVAFVDEFANMVIRVVDAYLQVFMTATQLDVLTRSRNDFKDLLDSAERRFEGGESTRLEILDLRARYQREAVQVKAAENAHRSAIAMLSSVVGGVDQASFERLQDAGGPLKLSRGSIEGWTNIARRSSTQLLAAESAVAQAEAGLGRAKGATLPRLDALASFGVNDSDSVNTVDQRFETGSLGLQLSVPIFSSGAGRAGVRQAEAYLVQAKAEYDAARLQLDQSVREAYDQFISVIEQERAMVAVKRSAEASSEAADRGYKAGVQAMMDVIAAKSLEREVALEALAVRYESARAFVVLHQLAGQVDEELIKTLSSALSGN